MARQAILIPWPIYDAVVVMKSDGSGYFTAAIIDDTDFTEARKAGCIDEDLATGVYLKDGILMHEWMGKKKKKNTTIDVVNITPTP